MGCGCVCCGNTQLDQSLVQQVCTVYTVWLQLHIVLHRCTTAGLRGIVSWTKPSTTILSYFEFGLG